MTDPNEKKAEAFDDELEDFDDTADDKPEDAFEEADGNDAVSEPTEELRMAVLTMTCKSCDFCFYIFPSP